MKQPNISTMANHLKYAVVFAPFFSGVGPIGRPQFVASVLAELMPVDVVTSDFDHAQKIKREHLPCVPFETVTYLPARPYYSNVGCARLFSHLLFSLSAAVYFKRNRDRYSVVYSTVPLNVLTWLVFCMAKGKVKIVDVVDIWPDVLPFSSSQKRLLTPIMIAWKWFFKSAVRKADVVLAVSDEFAVEAALYANQSAKVERFYIGQKRLVSNVAKQPIFTIAYIGNIGHLYDFETLLDVLADDELRKSMQLFVIGKGDRQEWLLVELKKRGIQHRYFGVVMESMELADILNSCHVGFNGYVQTSAAFSYKAVTYLAAGLPLLNSMTGDLQRLVAQHGIGENYTGGDRQQLKDALLRLYQGNSETLRLNAEEFFHANLEAGRVNRALVDFFAKLMDSDKNASPPLYASSSI